MYPYWCLEKGDARFVGPRDESGAWVARARGWIRVMHVDILCSLVIYTLVTVSFYLLGAAVLHRMGLSPAGDETVSTLSRIYTQTLGGWALWIFYPGVVVTLYGTIFAATAAHSRVAADVVRIVGGYRRDDEESRRRWRHRFVIVLASLPAIFYWLFASPVQMVVAGGVAQALLLPLIGTAAIYLRHRDVPPDLCPSTPTTVLLWVSTAVMFAFAASYVWSRIASG
jgi:Mn2+/Fe2+ NRAMP family transporter